MANLVIATPALADAGTISNVGSEAANLPATNLQAMQPSEVWRATTLGSISFELDLGAALVWNLVAILATNASADASVRIRAASLQGDLESAPVYDSGPLPHWPNLTGWTFISTEDADDPTARGLAKMPFLLWLGSSSQELRWLRIDIADPANADGFYEAGRLYVANAWQPTRNYQLPWSVGHMNLGRKRRTEGSQTYPLDRPRPRAVEFRFDFQSQTEMYDQAFEIDRLVGTAGDVLVVRDPASLEQIHRDMVCGVLSDLPPIVNRRFGVYSKTYRIEELI